MGRRIHEEPIRDLFASRIDKNAENAIDYSNPIIIANTKNLEQNPHLAKGANREVLIVYEEDNLLDHPLGKHVIKGRLTSVRPPLH